ncbi:MAG: DUF4248 domain-containing protein [Bacteroidales bacterium]
MPRACYFTELATLYSPHLRQRTAVEHLKRWIKQAHGLRKQLGSVGYMEGQRYLSTRMVEIIVAFFDEP